MINDPIIELCALLSRLPGVGDRTSHRFVHHLLGEPATLSEELGTALRELHSRVVRCPRCGNYASTKRGAESFCAICTDLKRDAHTICVVARVPDLDAIERGGYRGRYHVLHALLAPLDGMGPERIDVKGLRARVTHEQTREVILALPTSVEGEATAQFVAEGLRWQPEHTEGEQVRITRIASGMAFGHELEYADPITIGRAMEGRR